MNQRNGELHSQPAAESHEAREPRHAVASVFSDHTAAGAAIQQLKGSGLRDDQIGVVMRYRNEQGEFVAKLDRRRSKKARNDMRASLPAGLDEQLVDVSFINVPKLGPLLIAGAFASDAGGAMGKDPVAGAGAGAVRGGLHGALAGIGIPESSVEQLETGVLAGGVLVAAVVYENLEAARAILEQHTVPDLQSDAPMDEELIGPADLLETEARAELAAIGQRLHDAAARERFTAQPGQSAIVSGGDVDAAWDHADSGEETVGGSASTPDQDRVDELGEAVGIGYADDEPLHTTDKLNQRDRERWELDPRSAEKIA